jgi:ribosome-interacting GTPase 1
MMLTTGDHELNKGSGIMPANLPPMYFEAEKRYREAKTPEDKIEALEEMLAIMPKHKGTDKLKADLRRRIAKHKDESQQKKGGARSLTAYAIPREGAGQIVVIGPPNTGKSSLLARLTNANPEVGDFPHTTWKPTTGMVPYENIQFQLIDTPPMSNEYADPLMVDLLRRADLLVIVLDLKADILQQLEDTLSILGEWRIFPEGTSAPEDLKKPPFFKKILFLINKVDEKADEQDYEVFLELAEMSLPCLGVSVAKGRNVTAFIEKVYQMLGIIRVYTRAPGKDPDLTSPFVLPKASRLEDLAEKVHKDFKEKLKYARIWGRGVYDGQMVQKDYVLQEGDVAELHI